MSDLLVLVDIAERKCAIRADDVASVIEIERITPVPRAPDYIAGLTALRSQALTVIDCRRAIGANTTDGPTSERSPVVKVDGHSYALLVDVVHDVATAQSEPTPVDGGFGQAWSRVAQGMVETNFGPVLLLDISSLIAGPLIQKEVA